jgi:hypothetical protein
VSSCGHASPKLVHSPSPSPSPTAPTSAKTPFLRFQAKELGRFSHGSLTSSSTTSANPFNQQPPRWCSNAPELSSALTAAVYVYPCLFPHAAGSFEGLQCLFLVRSVCSFKAIRVTVYRENTKYHDTRIAIAQNNGTKSRTPGEKIRDMTGNFLDSIFGTRNKHTTFTQLSPNPLIRLRI